MAKKSIKNLQMCIGNYVDVPAIRKALVGRQAYDAAHRDEPYQITAVTDDLKIERTYLKDHCTMIQTIDYADIREDITIPDSERIEHRLVQENKVLAQRPAKVKPHYIRGPWRGSTSGEGN